MAQRFWVIGGDFSDCAFKQLEPGTEVVHGPYSEQFKAQMEWQRLTFRDHCSATTRYTICQEPEGAAK